jgi:spermidine synthase
MWSYEDVNFREPVKALFNNGYLATTTSPSGIAHAEALVHPAMVAHPLPVRALLISVTPNAIVREVLNHKCINHVVVLGSDSVATDM